MKKYFVKSIVMLLLIACSFFVIKDSGVLAQDKVELKIQVYDRSVPGFKAEDNYWTKYIQKEFGDPNNITVKFIPVPRWQDVDKLNVFLAAGDAPDVCFTYDQDVIYRWVRQGFMTDLGPILAKEGKELTKYLGPFCMKTGMFDGKQFTVAARRIMVGCMTAFIRKDWLDTLKLPMPKTRDEWYKALKAFKEKDPGNIGKENVIPFDLNLNKQNVTWVARLLLDSFVPATITEAEEQSLTFCVWKKPGYKDGMKFLNKMWNEGLIAPEFALDKNAKISEKNESQGKVGSTMGNFDIVYRSTPGISTELKKNVPNGLFVPVDCFKDAQGKRRKRQYEENGFYIFIPSMSKNSVAAVKYLNWMSNQKVLDKLLYGEEGTNFKERTKEGIPINIPQEGEMRLSIDIPIIVNGNDFGSVEKNILAGSLAQLPEYQDLWRQAYRMSITAERPYYDMPFPLESVAKYKTTLFEKDAGIFVQTITCKPEEFNALYDKLVKEFMDAGGEQVRADRLAYWQANYGSKKK
jgi:putative aldouronate transport system substrate-binding protein